MTYSYRLFLASWAKRLLYVAKDNEQARVEYSGPLVICVDDEPTAEQRSAIEQAERIGRLVLRVGRLDEQL